MPLLRRYSEFRFRLVQSFFKCGVPRIRAAPIGTNMEEIVASVRSVARDLQSDERRERMGAGAVDQYMLY